MSFDCVIRTKRTPHAAPAPPERPRARPGRADNAAQARGRVTPEGDATCHSCRCTLAFDDWLPTTLELQCSQGEPIVTYHAELSETGYVLEPPPER